MADGRRQLDILLLFPGQGSQKPGMCKDVAEAWPAARDCWNRADAALGTKLSALAFEGPAEELTQTRNAQPALLAHGAAVWAVTKDRVASHVRAAAGHSLGELTAYHVGGALTIEDAVRLVRKRGELMYETGVSRPGAMAAILGEMRRPIEEICEEASAAGEVVPANYNAPEQVVVSGEVPGVEKAMELAKAAGAKRAVRLGVSGAFHSPLMQPAADGLRSALAAAKFVAPAWPVYANVSAQPITAPAEARALLLTQLTSPVRWSQVIQAMAAAHPGALFVEMGPGNVLTGLLKRLAPGNPAMTCGTVADVNVLLERVSQ
jgi:[acyl-carrier-protein] S-malonyltransferase